MSYFVGALELGRAHPQEKSNEKYISLSEIA